MHGHHRFYLRKKFHKVKKPKKIIRVLAFAFFLSELGIWFIRPFLSIYINSILNDYALTGILFSFLALFPVVLDIPIGDFVDLVGRKIVSGTGLLLMALSGFLYPLAFGFNLLFISRVLQGVGVSFAWDSVWVMVRDETPKGKEAETMSSFYIGPVLAAIISPVLGGLLILVWGIQYNFILFSIFSVVAFFILIRFIPETLKNNESLKKGIKDFRKEKVFRKVFKDAKIFHPNLWVCFVLAFLFGMIFQSMHMMIPLLSEKINAGFVVLGVLFSIMALPGLLQGHLSEWADRISEEKAILTISILGVFVSLGFVFAVNVYLLFVFSFLLSFVVFTMNPPLQGILTKYAPHSEEGELTGVHQTFKHLGFLVGPFILGVLSNFFGLSKSFSFFALIFGLIAILSFLAMKLDFS